MISMYYLLPNRVRLSAMSRMITLSYVHVYVHHCNDAFAETSLDRLQVITRYKSWPALLAYDLSLPPSVVLVPQHRKRVALPEAELLWNGGLVHIHRSC